MLCMLYMLLLFTKAPQPTSRHCHPCQNPHPPHQPKQNSMYGWSEFLKEMKSFYQVDMDCLSDAYRKEQHDYYLSTSAWANVHPSQLLGPGSCFKQYDLHTVTLDELKVRLNSNSRNEIHHILLLPPISLSKLLLLPHIVAGAAGHVGMQQLV